MCKKLLIAAVAIGVGSLILHKTSVGSLVHVWWKDAKHAIEQQVPPETQINQLKVEIDKIDKDIKRNLSTLAAQEVDCQGLEDSIVALKENQLGQKARLAAMTKALDGQTAKVSFENKVYKPTELAHRLDNALALFESKKQELKIKEQLFNSKKQALEAAHARITEMKEQKDQLRTMVGTLEVRAQQNKLNQTRFNVDLDNSQVTRCKKLAEEINRRLMVEEKETEIFSQYGYNTRVEPAKTDVQHSRPTADVLKDAKKALDEDATKVAENQ